VDTCVLGVGVWIVGDTFAGGMDAKPNFSTVLVVAYRRSSFQVFTSSKQKPADYRYVPRQIFSADFMADFFLFDFYVTRHKSVDRVWFALRWYFGNEGTYPFAYCGYD